MSPKADGFARIQRINSSEVLKLIFVILGRCAESVAGDKYLIYQ